MFHTNQVFLKYLHRNDKNLNLYITENNLYYLALHIKLSSLFYSTQLVDIFAYEVPVSKNYNETENSKIADLSTSIVVYNFHSIAFHQRFFIFTSLNSKSSLKRNNSSWTSLKSITELFLNANWLERENSELHGIFFSGKKDIRNLMLQYGDTSAPFKKSFPSVGVKEVFYDSVSDLLIQSPVSIQF